MLAVIFKATIAEFDQEYFSTAQRLKDLAFDKYGCRDFVSVTEGDQEIAISYWDSLEQITAWKRDPQHSQAQQSGRQKWYRAYRVQVVKIEREYSHQW